MKIRLAVENDYEDVDKILNYIHNIHHYEKPIHFKRTNSTISKEKYTELLKNENNKVFLLELGNEIIGICNVNIIKIEETLLIRERTILQIGNIGVLPSYQRHGYGKRLIEFIKNYKFDKKIDTVQLIVWDFNEKAIEFYRKMGFVNRTITMELS
ncbi:GNAT family N-acetyltransferase [Cetobacterium somerae]